MKESQLKWKNWGFGFILLFFFHHLTAQVNSFSTEKKPFLLILGTLQDGGSPHLGCEKFCCKTYDPNKKIVSLGIIDPIANNRFLIEATPDINSQLKELQDALPGKKGYAPEGIFITHAHIGHYAGLMQLGREAMNSKDVKVYAMPLMKRFLENNGPWNQLIALHNIELIPMNNEVPVNVTPMIHIKPIIVPHRDEYSETIGFLISGPEKKVLFIPDIDKWEKWSTDIVNLVKQVDVALIDGTFYSKHELPNRKIEDIPHPLVQESLILFESLSIEERKKIMFIHFNHTNPLLEKGSEARQSVISKGFQIATIHTKIYL